MKPTWDDVNARARGLSTRLLGRRRLEELAKLASLTDLASELVGAGYAQTRIVTAPALEQTVRLYALSRMRLVTRWCGARSRLLLIVFEDEDRRSLRALVRGALAGVAADRRLSGLVPTPTLPERALGELARFATVAEIAATLTAWKNPYGQAMQSQAERAQPDLFRIEMAVNRLFAHRAASAARKAGLELRRFAEESVDLENVAAAMVLRREATDVEPEECFLEGGRRLDRRTFVDAISSETSLPLARALAGTPFAQLLAGVDADSSTFELATLRLRLRELLVRARQEPLSEAPLLAFLLRLRAQTLDLRHLIWTLSLGAPRTELLLHMVTV
jgi:vacuolar-type H+-ATPase subunit C/Vma6